MTDIPDATGPDWTRRRWLAGLTLLGLGTVGAADPRRTAAGGAEEAIRLRARKAGLKEVRTSETDHYLGIGDAPDAFRKEALRVCEGLATSYQNHFQAQGFVANLPAAKMAVVTLASRTSYEAFKGERVGEAEGGHYDIAANRLVVFDFRGATARAAGAADPRRMNTFTLVHEAVHQLTFTTGLLARDGDVPKAVSEGFAAYGETWRLAKPSIGKENPLRIDVLKDPGAGEWLPVDRLLTADALFDDPETEQLAYAESWLLLFHLLRNKTRAKTLRFYLDSLRPRHDATHRLADAGKAFGNLVRLDSDLKKAANRL